MQAFVNARIITPFEDIAQGTIIVEDQKIREVGRSNKIAVPPNTKIYDGINKIICPGFIDIHVHGAKGHDFAEATPTAINQIIDFHMAHGTTSFLPTLISMPEHDTVTALEQLPQAWSKTSFPSSFLGIHMEGPFLNPVYKGVHNSQALCLPSVEKIKTFFNHSAKTIKMITLAPELPNSIKVIQWLKRQKVVISMGHSDATYQQVKEAVQNGLQHSTHTFNAMRGLHHREPGALGAALNIKQISADIIIDGWHVHPTMIQILCRQKEKKKVILITDAGSVCGLANGDYSLWGSKVRLDEDKVFTLDSGKLAGSVMTMEQTIRNFKQFTQCSLTRAIQMATYNPAALLGIENQKGQLLPGNDADLVIMDKNLHITAVVTHEKIITFKT